jgi:hypothetical protein
MHSLPDSSQLILRRIKTVSTVAKVAWIDSYRARLRALLPEITPVDAAMLAVDAYFLQRPQRGCPDAAAEGPAARISRDRHENRVHLLRQICQIVFDRVEAVERLVGRRDAGFIVGRLSQVFVQQHQLPPDPTEPGEKSGAPEPLGNRSFHLILLLGSSIG